MNNQQAKIYSYMKTNGSITPMECFEHLKITKLATRIGEMKREGVRIGSEMEKSGDAWYKRYWLEPEEANNVHD